MNYFNKFELINDFISSGGRKLIFNPGKYLAKISKEDIVNNLIRKKVGLPINKDFKITSEPVEEENFEKLPEKVKNKLNKIFCALQKQQAKKMKKILKRLLAYQKDYPNVPAIYNYLGNAYHLLDDNDNQYKIIQETAQRFPDYLFGKTALAEYYIQNEMTNRVAKALDNKLEIFYHYPQKDVFHVSEVVPFYAIVGQYYLHKKKIEQALLCYFLLSEINPTHPATQQLGNKIIFSELEKFSKEAGQKINKLY